VGYHDFAAQLPEAAERLAQVEGSPDSKVRFPERFDQHGAGVALSKW
jgi:hypothetical protein